MYSIGEVAKRFNLPVSTLRYYDREGLFPDIQRVSGIRKFSDNEIEALRIIDCLKKSGLEIKDIKLFMTWTKLGKETYPARKELFEHQREIVEAEIEKLERVLDMLKFKSWYYDEAIKQGNEAAVNAQIPDNLPTDIHQSYLNTH